MAAPDRLLLLGLMGSGKTTVGRLVGARLGWPYRDNDDLLRAATGADGATLLAERGSEGLRAAEVAALVTALTTPGPAVIAVAGGVVLDPAGRAAVADGGWVVWLRADVDVLADRVAGDPTRARLGDDPAAALRQLGAAREPHYAALADIVVDAGTGSPEQVAERVVDEVAARRERPP